MDHSKKNNWNKQAKYFNADLVEKQQMIQDKVNHTRNLQSLEITSSCSFDNFFSLFSFSRDTLLLRTKG